MPGDPRRLVIIPSFNAGWRAPEVVRNARKHWGPVWIVTDGATDGTPALLDALARELPDVRTIHLPLNRGKGAAVLEAVKLAAGAGFTHFLCLDSDGQHPEDRIPQFMEASQRHPDAMILGKPVFGPDAPLIRVLWRKNSNALTALETLGGGIGDSLFGMRVYPIAPFLSVMQETAWARRFDFDPEAAVRLSWRGVPAVNLDTPVRYPSPDDGGVSHFRYLRDNLLLTWMHLRLLAAWPFHIPSIFWRRYRNIDERPSP